MATSRSRGRERTPAVVGAAESAPARVVRRGLPDADPVHGLLGLNSRSRLPPATFRWWERARVRARPPIRAIRVPKARPVIRGAVPAGRGSRSVYYAFHTGSI